MILDNFNSDVGDCKASESGNCSDDGGCHSISSAKSCSSRDSCDEKLQKGRDAVNYIQGMLKGYTGGRRRSIDWSAMPKEEGEEERDSKEDMKKEANLWWEVGDDGNGEGPYEFHCPGMMAYFKLHNVRSSYWETAVKMACKHSLASVALWSQIQCLSFLGLLNFPPLDVDIYRSSFRRNYVKGSDLLCVTEGEEGGLQPEKWWGLGKEESRVVYAVVMCWKGWGDFEIRGKPEKLLERERREGPVTDFAGCLRSDIRAKKEGFLAHYGQLVVLGYKEYLAHSNPVCLRPKGNRNEKFLLGRRDGGGNGIRRKQVVIGQGNRRVRGEDITHSVTMRVKSSMFRRAREESKKAPDSKSTAGDDENDFTIVTEYVTDPEWDMFQIGRLKVFQNDFVVRGPLTENSLGQYCGPISRYAARIMCNRITGEVNLFAAGFDHKSDIFLSDSAPKYATPEKPEETDAVTTFGLRIYLPSQERWVEVSVNGFMHEIREDDGVCGARIGNKRVRVEHGSIIDLSGVQLVYQDSKHMDMYNYPSPVQYAKFFSMFNDFKAQCPVELRTVRYNPAKTKELIGKMSGRGIGKIGAGGMIYDVEEDKNDEADKEMEMVFDKLRGEEEGGENELDKEGTAGVFGCGHIVTYSEQMVEGCLRCPLCRHESNLNILNIAYEPAIGAIDPPTHVFTCGCAASLECCQFWAKLMVPHNPHPCFVNNPICPFCATSLHPPYYTKLLDYK